MLNFITILVNSIVTIGGCFIIIKEIKSRIKTAR